jgi:hypothetical protein
MKFLPIKCIICDEYTIGELLQIVIWADGSKDVIHTRCIIELKKEDEE